MRIYKKRLNMASYADVMIYLSVALKPIWQRAYKERMNLTLYKDIMFFDVSSAT